MDPKDLYHLIPTLGLIITICLWWLRDRDKAKYASAKVEKDEALIAVKLATFEERVPEMIELQIRKSQEILIEKLSNGLGVLITKDVSREVKHLRADFDTFVDNFRIGIQHAVMEGLRNLKETK